MPASNPVSAFITPGRTLRLLAASAVAVASLPGCSPQVEADRIPPPPVVGVVEARQRTVPLMVEPIGTTIALQQVSIRARVRGFLKEMHFEEGRNVKAGQLLFVIDEEPFQVKLSEAHARLQAAEAELKKANDSKSREVSLAQLGVNQAILALNLVEESRQINLIRRGAASQEDVDRAVAIRKRSEAEVQGNKASLDQARADYDTNILSAQADVAAAQSAVRDAELDLGYCRMTSPIDGRAGLAEVKVGNLVGPAAGGGGQDYTELVVIRQLDPMGVDIPAASRYLDRVARLIGQGLPVEVFRPGLEGEEDRRFRGLAKTIDNTIDPTTSTFLVRAEIANPDGILLPGEYVKSDAKVGEIRDAILVPEQAIIETQAGATVYTVDRGGKVVVVPVRASVTIGGLRVLESGLKPGQKVVVEGLQLVRNGMTVKTRPAVLDQFDDEALLEGNGPSRVPEPGPLDPSKPETPRS